MSIFQAVWPVLDSTMSYEDLKAEAIEDLPKVARRHGVITVGEPRAIIRLGREVPGAGPAALVVVVESPVADIPPIEVLDFRTARACDRCGVEKTPKSSTGEYYCTDCKQYVKADGWLENAS